MHDRQRARWPRWYIALLLALMVAACGAPSSAPAALMGAAATVALPTASPTLATTAVPTESSTAGAVPSVTAPPSVTLTPAPPTRTAAASPTVASPVLLTPTPTVLVPIAPVLTPRPADSRTLVPATSPLVPIRLRVPRLGVDAAVEPVGLTDQGAMDVPKRYEDVAWYRPGARPGQRGSAVIAGHLDSKTGPAVFWRLREMQVGDEILVIGEGNQVLRFVVEETASYPYDQAPIERIFSTTDRARLNLISCVGVFDRSSRNYDKRLVVYATLVR